MIWKIVICPDKMRRVELASFAANTDAKDRREIFRMDSGFFLVPVAMFLSTVVERINAPLLHKRRVSRCYRKLKIRGH